MNNLPEDLQKEILSFLMVCGKNSNYIVNKETYNYFKLKNFHKCGPVIVLDKHICKNCDKNAIKYFQMICMNCAYY
tara:strand:- start:447 stop:674 length:228 start_codon:yes stop_codon:yes gene_type:complete